MPAITLDVPEKLAERITAIPENKRNDWFREVLEDALNDEETPASPLTEADHKTTERGLEDLDAGRVVDSDTFFTALYEKVGLPAPPPFAEAVQEARQQIKAARRAASPPPK